MRAVGLALLVLVVGAVGVAALVVRSGVYDVAADKPHWQPVYTVLEATMRYSVRRRASAIEEPPLDEPGLLLRGAACFSAHCVSCHGAPGVAPAPPALAMQPLPGPLVDAASAWRARELVWIMRHGIRMSGMPAWGGRLPDEDIWAVAALLQQLPQLSPESWAALDQLVQPLPCPAEPPLGQPGASWRDGMAPTAAAATRGRAAMYLHGCPGCHVIPGVVGSPRQVGPPLAGYGRRSQIKGRWDNNRDNLAAWVRDPQALDPGTAMPSIGMHEGDAQAIAVYLLTLR